MLAELTEARLLSEIYSDHRDNIAYQPACDTQGLTVAGVIERLDQQGVATVPVAESTSTDKLRETVRRLREITDQSPANLRLQDL